MNKSASFRLFVLGALLMLVAPVHAVTFKFSAIGYHPLGAKVAVVEDIPEDQHVELVLFDPVRRNPRIPLLLGTTVFKIDRVKAIQTKQMGPGTKSLLVDFSDFKEPGSYELRLEGTDIKSEPVRITEFLYWDTLKPVVKTFYFQRCGQDVEDRSLKMFHSACHIRDAEPIGNQGFDLGLEEDLDVVGGWHNGSDYAKYVTSTALSAARLLAMYEWSPKPYKFFRLEYPLFEKGYGTTSDLLHEVKAGLDWLLAMQRRDGAVYRKVAGKQWPGKVAPDDDEQPRYAYGVSTQDTANAAAVFAMASRNYKKEDLGYSVKTLLAAEKAWGYLQAHPAMAAQRSDSDFAGSGEFLDPRAASDTSYRVWAAAELYISTGKTPYHQYFLAHLKDVPLQRFSWFNPALQGIVDYLLYAPQRNASVAEALKRRILETADQYANAIDDGVWPSGLKQYSKSSNQEAVERANLLMAAYKLSGEDRYRAAASRMVVYLFGVNPLGKTYVTGLEGKPVTQPSHRWMEASGKVIPGYLVDGPNETPTDGKTPKGLGALSYVDEAAATSVNESTLLNNAALAYLLAALNDAYNAGQAQGEPKGPASPLDVQLAPERPQRK